METVVILVKQLVMMAILLGVGILIYRIGLISAKTSRQLSDLVLYVINPFLCLSVFNMPYDPSVLTKILIAFMLGLLAHLLFFVISFVFRIRKTDELTAVRQMGTVFGNSSFMGTPIAVNLLGSVGGVYNNMYNVAFQIWIWSFKGLILDKKEGARESVFAGIIRIIRKPAILAIIAGLIMYAFRLSFPDVIQITVDTIGSANTPLAMIVAGAFIAQSDALRAFGKIRIWILVLVRNIVAPLCLIPLLMVLTDDRTLALAILVSGATPLASMVMFFNAGHEKRREFATEVYAVSTVMSVVTMPVIIMIAQTVL